MTLFLTISVTVICLFSLGEVDVFTDVEQIRDSKKPYIREFAEMTMGELFENDRSEC